MGFFEEMRSVLLSGQISDKDELEDVKLKLSKKYGLDYIPSDVEILNSSSFDDNVKRILRRKPTRTISGVAVVAAMTSPERCPHGKCIFCPGGIDNNSPQSYTGYEPAALRGRNNAYDPYMETFSRIKQLETIGHDTSKIDLIIMGGTFTARDTEYQRGFVKGCLDAMNGVIGNNLDESIRINETSRHRCIGLTVETKPDWFFEREIDLALSYGTTKVELGVQNINDNVLAMNNRGHTVNDIARSTQLARDAGLKIVYHIMPGMYGSNPDLDLKSFELMIGDPRFRPDMLKIYPTLVTKGTGLYNLWKNGRYRPYTTNETVELIVEFMRRMPEWIRVQRIQRDIPVQFIVAGVKRSDIRNLIEKRMKDEGIETGEIRFREIGHHNAKNEAINLKVERYDAGGGREYFISYVTESNRIVGFVRLRIPSDKAHRQEVSGSSIIRELKVFGYEVPVGKHEEDEWQHRGFGTGLVQEAERITLEEGLHRILVISGIGVREYFRKRGYEDLGPYVAKRI
ncbi:tRNA uridine(34) 5-carboxymethylaminomethyl modification radical SAM/GNAT enzyme Elp3 [Thermoplasma sp.]|uniref:tRNA uridine(34) 5-carboxymethylaminomethyl modification radical SAM/GNAT enzyme Elp3 n=1 Tax=Thermoplasma sp. TaxID=1973142 RepID=UPI00261435DE|nr:tRNA uridine(34) 5-carboxymethylaminomethyl modification radical SAM/GNAT enzyme Elp3 [Thermoplasma sp.]